MFPTSFFCVSYFPPRYFPRPGASLGAFLGRLVRLIGVDSRAAGLIGVRD